MTKPLGKQRSIRFKGDLEERLAALAETEDRTFSAVVNRLLRQALRSYAPQAIETRPAAVEQNHAA
jgi:predicted DNA-binding protein